MEVSAAGSTTTGVADRRGGASPTPAQRIALVVATLVGVVLRWWDLGGPMATFDEAFTGVYSHLPVGEIPGALRTADSHPPLDYVLRHWFGGVGDTFALRAPSAIFATATLCVVLWWMWRRAWFGVAVVTITSVSSFALLYGHTARMYALVVLCGTLIAAATERWLLEPQLRWMWLMSGSLLLGLLDHSSVLVLAGALLLVPGRRTDRRSWQWRAGVAGAVAIWVALWGPSFLAQLRDQGSSWIPYTTARSLLAAVNGLVSMYSGTAIVVMLAVVVGAVLLRSEDRTLARVWVLLGLVPLVAIVLIGLRTRFFLPRTLAFAAWAPPLALAAVVERGRRASPSVAVATFALVAVLVLPSVEPSITYEEGSVPARRALAADLAPGDAVAVHPVWLWPLAGWDLGVPRRPAVPAELAALDAFVSVPGDAPFGGRVWVLQPDSYAMATDDLVACADIETRHLGDYLLSCYRTVAPPS